jgi:hypothetical protein
MNLRFCLALLPALGALAADDPASSRLAELREQLGRTSQALAGADGYPARAGRIDVQVAEWFADYIEWELAHPEIMREALMADRVFDKRAPDGPDEAARRYTQHINRELDGAFTLLERAAARPHEQRDWPEVRAPDWSAMTFSGGHFRNGRDPVFPAGFNMVLRELVDLAEHPEAAEESRARLDAFLAQMSDLGVGVVGHGISIPAFLDRDGGIRHDLLHTRVQEIERLAANGFKVAVLFHWGGDPVLLEDRWPGITHFRGNGVAIDIDHPGSRELVRQVGNAVLPALGKLPGIVAWDMANEPFFDMNAWSPHGLRNYHAWLEERH